LTGAFLISWGSRAFIQWAATIARIGKRWKLGNTRSANWISVKPSPLVRLRLLAAGLRENQFQGAWQGTAF